jgi:2-polyprenyl-6-methoxyphenol hydroxylase-like FAD-dependent oxidoreductase
MMSKVLGRRAIVIGAGIGGLAAAGAVAPAFEQVLVLERDELPSEPAPRRGAPQSNQLHGLLAGGAAALGDLFPGIEADLVRAGASPTDTGLDSWLEFPGVRPLPRREIGVQGVAMSRPLLEHVIRARLARFANVEIRQRCTAIEVTAGAQGEAGGVRCRAPDGALGGEIVAADLVVDAAAQSDLTLAFLRSTGFPTPEESVVEVDIAYASAAFDLPPGVTDVKLVATFPQPPDDAVSGYAFQIDHGGWMALIARIHSRQHLRDWDDLLAAARGLRTPTLYEILRRAENRRPVMRFGFPRSVRRRYERLERFPRGLLPLGDALCRFNPVYGQGMTVAAQEAVILGQLLAGRVGAAEPLAGLAGAYFHAIRRRVDAAWAISTAGDLCYPQTVGVRPPDFARALETNMAIRRLAVQDPAVHRLWASVFHMLEPPEALHDPELLRRAEVLRLAAA